jgi:hypothetical protein
VGNDCGLEPKAGSCVGRVIDRSAVDILCPCWGNNGIFGVIANTGNIIILCGTHRKTSLCFWILKLRKDKDQEPICTSAKQCCDWNGQQPGGGDFFDNPPSDFIYSIG